MSVFRHFDADWRRVHVVPHLVGGVVHAAVLLAAILLVLAGHPFWAAWVLATYVQGLWERFQREYDPTYPAWSMVGDTVIASVAAGVTLFSLSRVL